ncbi:MAG: ceramide glucosyltransferase [Gammaproteobacteria bacterium]|nr:ceramide glucosyltransferase [Gammaproteobacteria bacterium]
MHAARHYVYFALHGKVSPLPGAARAFRLQRVHFLTINPWAWFVEFGYAVALAAMLYSLAAAFAMRRPISPVDRSGDRLPPVTILKPLCGAEPDTYSCLRSFCLQAFPNYQVVFGVSDPNDPVISIVRRLQREYPQRDLALVIEQRSHGINRKVSNLINMMAAARHDFLVISDSDVRVASDYLGRIVAPLTDEQVGIVTCCYRGVARSGVWSILGSMFINEWFLPSVRVAAMMGFRSFAFGASIALRRDTLERIGGFSAVAGQLADDYRLGELTRRLGLVTVLSDVEVETMVREQSVAELISHELRWRRTIRILSPSGYRFSFITFGLPITTLQLLVAGGTASAVIIFAITALSNASLHVAVDGHRSRRAKLLLVPLRDLLHCALWGWSFVTRRVQWRSDLYHVTPDGSVQPVVRT